MSADFRRRKKLPGVAQKVLSSAAGILLACERCTVTLDDALDGCDVQIRRMLEHLLMNCLRYRKFLEKRLLSCCSRTPDPEVRCLIMAAYAQALFQSSIASQSAVNVAVDIAKTFHAAPFVNAVLRKLLASAPELPENPEDILPDTLLDIWQKSFDAQTLKHFSRLFLTPAPMSFRVLPGFEMPSNAKRIDDTGSFEFAVLESGSILEHPEFAKGAFYIQDPATSMVINMLAPYVGNARTALDICAAPGGKTLMFGEVLPEDCQITASDVSRKRQQRSSENFSLRNRNYKVITSLPENIRGEFDAVLADVPCSNTGVFRRRPDALWRFTRQSLAEVMDLQRSILAAAAKLTAPGGILVFSTCSIEEEENSGGVRFLLTEFPGQFELLSQKTLLPSESHDGAFAAVFRKKQ